MRDHDVVGFQITMHDARGVCFPQAFRDLEQVFEQKLQLTFFAVNLFPQGLAVDKLHCDEVRAVSFANLVDVRDVRMIEGGRRFRFLDETAHAVLVRSKVSRQNLQCDFPIEPRVLRQVNFTHPTCAKF